MHPDQADKGPAYTRWTSQQLRECICLCMQTYPQDMPSSSLPTTQADLSILISHIKTRQSMPLTRWFCRQLRVNRLANPRNLPARPSLVIPHLPLLIAEDTKRIDRVGHSQPTQIGR